MPPKPFQPPRPVANPSTGRPKKSKSTAAKSKPDTGLSYKKKAIEKKQKQVSRTSTSSNSMFARSSMGGGGGFGTARNMGLPSLSPDTTKEAVPSSPEQIELSDEDVEDATSEDDPFSSQPKRTKTSRPEPEEDDDADPTSNREEQLPADLLKVLLQQFFQKEDTRIKSDASKAVAKYMETFVRESIARCVWARAEGEEGGGGFLEVEDLEKLAPQMLMDF